MSVDAEQGFANISVPIFKTLNGIQNQDSIGTAWVPGQRVFAAAFALILLFSTKNSLNLIVSTILELFFALRYLQSLLDSDSQRSFAVFGRSTMV